MKCKNCDELGYCVKKFKDLSRRLKVQLAELQKVIFRAYSKLFSFLIIAISFCDHQYKYIHLCTYVILGIKRQRGWTAGD